MSVICKACSTENRDDARFCAICGVPLPAKKEPEQYQQQYPKTETKVSGKFLAYVIITLLVAGAITGIVFGIMSNAKKNETITKYTGIYEESDRANFSGINASQLNFEGLNWNMNLGQLKKVYPFLKQSSDPDFFSSVFVGQQMFKRFIPHANFMSLGMYEGKLYAVKMEFSDTDRYKAQEVGVPNSEFIIYGRFKGLLKVMKAIYGEPAYEKSDIKGSDIVSKVRDIKNSVPNSNLYIYWMIGKTKVELVLFGYKRQIKLTVRMLYMPIWSLIGKT
ncbi:MAG: zinc-ribbon domain-containing protein [bacterium]